MKNRTRPNCVVSDSIPVTRVNKNEIISCSMSNNNPYPARVVAIHAV